MSKTNALKRLTMLGAMMAAMMAALPAMGQTQYVFMYNNYFVAESTTPTTSFVPNASVYSGSSGGTFRNGNNYYIRYNNGLQFSTTNSSNLYIYNNYLGYAQYGEQYISYGYFYPLNMNNPNNNNRAWRMSNNNSNQATAYTVTTEVIKMLSDFTISGNDILTSATTYPYTHTNSYLTNHTKYSWTDHTYYSTNPAQAASTTAPAATEVTTGYTWTLEGGGTNASVNASSGQITVSSLPATDLIMTLTCSVTNNGVTKTASKTVVLQGTTIAAPSITRTNNDIILATTSVGATIYYTTNGSTPSASNGSAYTIPFSLEELTLPVTIKAIAIRGGVSSTVAEATYNSLLCATPEISIASNGAVTITCATAGASIRYTTDGTNPSTSSGNVYSGSFNVSNLATVKAIAYKDGYDNSQIASEQYLTTGVNGDYVILDDREDHSWAYYSDPNCPIRSLNPANVKITYYGNGVMMTGTTDYTASRTDTIHPGNSNYVGSAKVNVTAGETQNTFVYYKTLERTDGSTSANPTGRCPYTTIPNPFQVRPTYGGTATSNTADWAGWRGFQCWRLKSVSGGSVYSAASGGTALTAGAVINGETQIYFAPTSEYGMAVDLEAVWAIAYVVKTNGTDNACAIGDHSNVGYERNFIVLNTTSASYNFGGTSGKRITNIDRQVTVTRYLPNGVRGQNNDATYVRGAANNYNLTLQANAKFENVAFNMGENTLTAAGYDLIIGRGCTGTVNVVRGINANVTSPNYTLRIESGTYNNVSILRGYGANTNQGSSTDGGNNLGGTPSIKAIFGCDYDRATNNGITNNLIVTYNIYYASGVTANNTTYSENALNAYFKSGKIGNGITINNNHTAAAQYTIYMGAAANRLPGHRKVFVEGGELSSIAGGIDGEGNENENSLTLRMTGGHVRGAIYGGGARSAGYGNRKFVITGGDIVGWVGGGCNGETMPANGDEDTYGGITYGSSKVYFGGNAVCGGTGSNIVINGSIGGTVFGAGKGVEGNTTSGRMSQGTTVVVADECDIERNVYGGGNFGYAQTSTAVYVAGGHVHGDIFGGSNQNNGPDIDITMRAGKIDGGLYGGSNTSGNITGHINIDVYGTDPQDGANYAVGAVYGGGNQANYSGAPNVNVHCGEDISIEYVYGGGNAATVTGTNVTIEGGNKIGNVFGGCYGANVTTNGTKVNVKGGTIGKVFGGNNQSGSITGGIKVRVDKQSTCPMKIGELYGGGNVAASAVGSIDIGCTGALTAAHSSTPEQIGYTLEGIGDLYGGANEANITSGNVNLTIDSGMVYRVFGGNNTSGTISGTITVNIDKQDDACGWYVGYVYGGGNKAPYGRANQNFPVVNVSNGLVSYNVYGGGKGNTAIVTGNPQVTLDGTAEVGGNVYGGGDAAAVTGSTKVTLKD